MTVTLEQAQSSLKELIERTAHGEQVVITENQTPVAELVSIAVPKPKPTFGSCKGMLIIIADDDEHLKDFEEYMR